MSREMTGQLNEGITCSPGGLSALDGGPMTVGVVWRPLALSAMGLIKAMDSGGSPIWNVNPFSDGLIYYGANGFTSTTPTAYNDTTAWRHDWFTKADLSATVTHHWYKFSGASSLTWNHNAKGSVGDSVNLPATSIRLGAQASNEALNGRLGALVVYSRVLTNLEIESCTNALQPWKDLTPAALWKFNTNDVVSGAVDLSGNGANETSHSATSFSADEPSPFNYTLSGGGDPFASSRFMPFFRAA